LINADSASSSTGGIPGRHPEHRLAPVFAFQGRGSS